MLVFQRNTVISEDEQTLLTPSAIAHGVEDAGAMYGTKKNRFGCPEDVSHPP
jgi:hypothetical protein